MSDIQIGQIIEVEVVRTENYGIFCQYNERTIFIDIVHISWVHPIGSPHLLARPGEKLRVIIGKIFDDGKQIGASIRERYPNPWEGGVIFKGSQHNAKVICHVERSKFCPDSSTYILELLPGSFTVLCDNEPILVRGQNCDVIVDECFPSRSVVKLKRKPSAIVSEINSP